MIDCKLLELAELAQASLGSEKFKEVAIRGISTDTRKIEKGNLFVPLVGDKFDGHKFIDQAIANGASACLWQSDHELMEPDFPHLIVEDSLEALQTLAKNYRDSLDLKIIAITGSNGKTTSKDIMEGILLEKYKTQKTEGNLNNHIGVPLTLLALEKDTEIGIIEMGTDDFGQIDLLTRLASPDLAMITNIGPSHLELLSTKENVARAKFEILNGLKPGGSFIYNGDDPILNKVIKEFNPEAPIRFGKDQDNDYSLELVSEGLAGISFNIYDRKEDRKESFDLAMIGRHNLYNAGLSIIVARILGLDYDDIRRGFKNIRPTAMRNELIEREDFTILNDSYKSNPDSLLAAYHTLYSIEGYDHRAVVLGDMLDLGPEISQLHYDCGRKLDPSKVDQVFCLGRYGRDLADGALENFKEEAVFKADTKEELLKLIRENLKKNSLVLVKASRSVALEDIIEKLI